MSDDWLWPAAFALLGLVFGSFIATFAIRWPQHRSALHGRSRCDGCGRTLAPRELVPLVSWLVLRGRCRSCGSAIAIVHPVIELLGLTVGLVAGLLAPGWEGAAGALFGWLLLALGAVDFACLRLPNALTGALSGAGLLAGLTKLAPPLADRLAGGVAGWLSLFLVAGAYRHLRGREGLGGGDAKLFGAIGLWLGWRDLAPVLLVACGLGFAVIAAMMLRGRRVASDHRLPLGTLLAASAFLLWAVARI